MRPIWVVILGVAAVVAAPAGAAPWHERPQMPWCAVFTVGPSETAWDCSYPTLEACVPEILAGTRGFCNPNPRYPGPMPKPEKHRRKH